MRKKVSHFVNHIFDDQGKKLNINASLAGNATGEVWLPATGNELKRLAQG